MAGKPITLQEVEQATFPDAPLPEEDLDQVSILERAYSFKVPGAREPHIHAHLSIILEEMGFSSSFFIRTIQDRILVESQADSLPSPLFRLTNSSRVSFQTCRSLRVSGGWRYDPVGIE
jgi:hypothetical protein